MLRRRLGDPFSGLSPEDRAEIERIQAEDEGPRKNLSSRASLSCLARSAPAIRVKRARKSSLKSTPPNSGNAKGKENVVPSTSSAMDDNDDFE